MTTDQERGQGKESRREKNIERGERKRKSARERRGGETELIRENKMEKKRERLMQADWLLYHRLHSKIPSLEELWQMKPPPVLHGCDSGLSSSTWRRGAAAFYHSSLPKVFPCSRCFAASLRCLGCFVMAWCVHILKWGNFLNGSATVFHPLFASVRERPEWKEQIFSTIKKRK